MKPITREWARKAENDFKVASQILRRRKDIVPDAACFFCQQCVEKDLSLKAGFEKPSCLWW
jgi:HEPN domain-containing protein